jgi:hypothetical protein
VRDRVDQLLSDGMPIRAVAATVARSKSAVSRHKLHQGDERDPDGRKLDVQRPARKLRAVHSRSAKKSGKRAEKRSVPSLAQTGRSSRSQAGRTSIESREALVERLHHQLDAAEAILTDAQRRRDGRLALSALKEAREVLGAIGKALGFLTDGTTINIDNRRQSLALVEKLAASGVSDDVLRALAWSDDAIEAEVRALPSVNAQTLPASGSGEV